MRDAGGKNQRSPALTSAAKLWPSLSTAVMRALPASMNDHSASLCQCSSRTPPAVRRMLTPAIVLAIGNSRCVTSLDQPPGRIFMCVSANEKRRFGIEPWSVAGGVRKSGFSASRSGSRGPRMVAPLLPSMGLGGLPCAAAAAAVADRTIEPARRVLRVGSDMEELLWRPCISVGSGECAVSSTSPKPTGRSTNGSRKAVSAQPNSLLDFRRQLPLHRIFRTTRSAQGRSGL